MFEELKKLLKESVQKNKADSMLLSGGLDTSILALIMKELGMDFLSVCVSLEGRGKDIAYVKQLEDILGIKVLYVQPTLEEAESAIPHVIRVLESFDPAIPNDLVVYFALKTLKEKDIHSAITGDGADELFAGYNYMSNIEDLEEYIEKVSRNLNFNSEPLGRFFGISVKRPYLDEDLKSFALRMPRSFKIREGFGKWILRKAYEPHLPKDILYQEKRPLEVGSSMGLLREHISSKIEDEEYREKGKLYNMSFYGKDHLFYFEIYKRIFGDIPKPKPGEIECSNCGAGKKGNHCKVCGFVEDI